jgi:hypothetical protein
MTEYKNLSKRIDRYINSAGACQLAIGLLVEQRKHLSAANKGAERNMNVAMILFDRSKTNDKR